ncbi:DUF427-domain-containing protein [Teratosphaeria nubilosa]|uniref:DUF427-domain-containing protein n=1 Tax=Teratosphaeria nubilosa TaxID=161662 RepID=A0A6G1KZF0_9PEZI|nr:DUF427-domain-containing protein [Teratosphaeria nubilosa]
MHRIADARSKGRTNVNLSQEEMEALERRSGIQQPEPSPSPAMVSPPLTPSKSSKSKSSGSRSSSSTSLVNSKGRKKGEKSSSTPAKSNSKAKVERKPVPAEPSTAYNSASGPQGIMVPGPNGVPIFAPLVSYPPSPEIATRAAGMRPRSRSSSKHSRRVSTPPERIDAYAAYASRYYAGQGMRPPSSGSNRSIGDEYDYYPPSASRTRSVSNAQYYRPAPPDDYDVPVGPATPGRRNASGPADVRYGSVRRVPPGSSPLAPPRPGAQHANSDPAVSRRKGGVLGTQLERTSSGGSSSSDDQGVQVNIVPDASGGYSINRAAVVAAPAVAPSSGTEARRRKGARSQLRRLAIKLGTDGPHKVLPTPKQIKILFNGSYIIKTTNARYVWEHPFYPQYYVPYSELQSTAKTSGALKITEGEKFAAGDAGKTLARQLRLSVGEKSTDDVLAFSEELEGLAEGLRGLVKIGFEGVDRWFEEDLPIFVHPKDPFKRIEILASARPVRVFVGGQKVAETTTSMHLYETGLPVRYYIPLTSVDPGVLRRSETRTRCPYKGESEYYSVVVGGETYEDVVWFYDRPTLESAQIAGLVCFYNEKVDIELDGEILERPVTHFGKSKPRENKKPSAV